MSLSGRKILLGITGGIAAYKCAELVRLLKKAGADVQVVMTRSAQAFITPLTLQALSGRPVRTALLDTEQESAMGHIELARWADIILVAPATANFLSVLAQGAASDLLSTLCLATESPVIVAPAMNRQMWANPATQRNVTRVEADGIKCWGPAEGEQACGETGEGRMLEPEQLKMRLDAMFSQGPLQGAKVVITAGPTHEPIDPVRYIGNRSSGKMGYALAQSFQRAGALVKLVSGPVELPAPAGVETVKVNTADEMYRAVLEHIDNCDIFAACAAVADFHVANVADYKIKKPETGTDPEAEMSFHIQLLPNVDILAEVAGRDNPPFTLGFAAETHDVIEYAEAKRRRKSIDMIAANLVGAEKGGFCDDENALTVISEQAQQQLPMQNKQQLADQLLDLVIEHYNKKIQLA